MPSDASGELVDACWSKARMVQVDVPQSGNRIGSNKTYSSRSPMICAALCYGQDDGDMVSGSGTSKDSQED